MPAATTKVQFTPNVPVEVALKYPAGKLVSGQYGDQYYYSLSYSSDGAPGMYLDPDVEHKITGLRIRENEKFWICKRKGGGRGAAVTWDVWRGPEKGVMEGRIEREERPTQIERDLARSIDRIHSGPGFGFGNGQGNGQGNGHGELRLPLVHEAGIPTGAEERSIHPAPDRELHGPIAERTSTPNGASSIAPRPAKTQLEDALITAIAACHSAQEYARSIGFGLSFSSEDVAKMAILIGKQRNGQAA